LDNRTRLQVRCEKSYIRPKKFNQRCQACPGDTVDLTTLIQTVQNALGSRLPTLLGAVAVGIVGWLAAVIIRSVVRRGLQAINLDRQLHNALATSSDIGTNNEAQTVLPVSNYVARGAYALVMVLTLIAVLSALNLASAAGPLTNLANEIISFLPRLFAGLVLCALAWVCAIVVRAVVRRLLTSSLIDIRLAAASGRKARVPVSLQLAQVAYGLTLLMFLPAVLGTFQMHGLLAPVQALLAKLLGALPNLLAAAAIVAVGYLLAKMLRRVVTDLFETIGLSRLGHRADLGTSFNLSALAATTVYAMVLLTTLITALDTLKIEAVSVPASTLLKQVIAALPKLAAAALILAVTYFVTRIVAKLATDFLAGLGVDRLPALIGLTRKPAAVGPSVWVGKALMFFALLLATGEAAKQLGFTRVAELSATLVRFGGDLVLGALVLITGYWLANLAHSAIQRSSGTTRSPLASLVRFAILGLVLAMGLRAMGIAPDIVNLAFALSLGAVAVAGALSFGLGGRDAAGRQIEHWFSNDTSAAPKASDTTRHTDPAQRTKATRTASDRTAPPKPDDRSAIDKPAR
jgi:Conserved TM helix